MLVEGVLIYASTAPSQPMVPYCAKLREFWIEENVQRSNPFVTDNDDVQPGIIGSFASRTRTPGENSSVVKSLGLSMRRVCKMRVGRAKVTSELVHGVASDEHAWWNIEYAIVSIELVNGCTAAGGIPLAEDLL
jgi:hypothetical protein